MPELIPLLPCRSCFKHLEAESSALPLLRQIIKVYLNNQKATRSNFNLVLEFYCPYCGQKNKISGNEDLKKLLAVVSAFEAYLEKIQPKAPSPQGAFC